MEQKANQMVSLWKKPLSLFCAPPLHLLAEQRVRLTWQTFRTVSAWCVSVKDRRRQLQTSDGSSTEAVGLCGACVSPGGHSRNCTYNSHKMHISRFFFSLSHPKLTFCHNNDFLYFIIMTFKSSRIFMSLDSCPNFEFVFS